MHRSRLVLLVVALASVLLGPPAHASQHDTSARKAVPNCTYNDCQNKGPVAQNCDDTGVVYGRTTVGTNWGTASPMVQLIYSSGCHSYWARGQSVSAAVSDYYSVKIVKRRNSDGAILYQHVVDIATNLGSQQGMMYDWTNMAGVQGGTQVKACAGWRGNWECTPWWP